MSHISDYSREAIESQMSLRLYLGHDVTIYNRHTEFGVTEIYYYIDVTKKMKVLGFLTIIPIILYSNFKEKCTKSETVYFDSNTGEKISYLEAQNIISINKKATNLIVEGDELFKKGSFSEALERYKTAISLNREKKKESIYTEKLTKTLLKIADNHLNEGMYYSALAKYKEAYSLNKQVINFSAKYNTMGEMLIEKGRFEDAIYVYHNAINLDSKNSMYLENIGFAFHLSGNYEEAIKFYDKALEINKDFMSYTKKGESLKKLGKISDSNECFTNAMRLKEKIRMENKILIQNGDYFSLNSKEVELVKSQIIYQLENLWEEAWNAENESQTERAEKLFEEVKKQCLKALEFIPSDEKLKLLMKKYECKIMGNKYINSAIDYHEKANEKVKFLNDLNNNDINLIMSNYNKSEKLYLEAKNQYVIGNNIDNRFSESIGICDESVKDILEHKKKVSIKENSDSLKNLNLNLNDNFNVNNNNLNINRNLGFFQHI